MPVYVILPSGIHLTLLVLVHLAAIVAILLNNMINTETGSLIVLGTLLSLHHEIRHRFSGTLRLHNDRWFNGSIGPQKLASQPFIGRWFIVMRLSSSGWIVIGADSLPRNEFRELSVLLRARTNRMMAG